jgi:glycosyltransferase involved in cell wall biosynthesis
MPGILSNRLAGRVWRGLRRRAGHMPAVRNALLFLADVPPVALRNPRLAIAIARADIADSGDPAMVALLDRALDGRRSAWLLARKAQLLTRAGELTAARDTWRELAARGNATAAQNARLLDGRLTETDPTWLPVAPGEPERLVPLSPRRVLHIAKNAAPQRWSGFTIRTLRNLHAQQAAGLEPTVVTKIGWPRETGVSDVPAAVTFEGIEHHYLDRGAGYRHKTLPLDVTLQDMTEDLVPLVRELRPAILHVHSGHRGGELVLAALALRQRFGIPVVYEVRGLFESSWTADLRYGEHAEAYFRRLDQETRLLRDVDGVIAISEALADHFVSRGIARDKITVVPNGIDPVALDVRERDPGLRARLGLDGSHVVGYLGNLDHWREGIDVLLASLAELRRRGRTDVKVLIVGDGALRASMEGEARRLRVADGARFTGRVPHDVVGDYYAQMDVFVNPRADERAARFITPLKPYEAMALGIPVLVSDLPALREIVDPPNRGAVAPPGDPRALADAIENLIDDPARRARLGEAGRAWVRAERTWLSNGPRYRTAYEAIIRSPS